MIRKCVAISLLVLCAAVAFAAVPDIALKSAADLLNAGHADEAVALLGSRIKAQPTDAAAYNLLARTYYAMGRWDDAVAAGEKAVALEPGNSSYHMWLCRMYGEKADHSSFVTAAGLVKKIRAEFERAVQIDATNLDARTDLAEFYLEAPGFMGGGKDKARQQAASMASQDAAAAHWLEARIAEKDKRYPDAEREYKSAIESSGYQARYWLNLASFFKRQHRYNEMEAAISSAVNSDRKKPANYVDAATLLVGAGRNFIGAAQFIRKYLTGGQTTEEAPTFKAHYVLGEILEKQGDKAGAAAEYRAALQLAKDYSDAKEALARLEQH
ncbi:MAG TPA: tetratricopeptide repeat protein [Terriglobia bacterium]|nr:tetratricopeptide repeat protein [Terriglobia bacterium]